MADPLQTSLKAWYSCDEASGNLIDAHATVGDATDTNTVQATTGKVSGARLFARLNQEYFSRASNSSCQLGGGDFTIAAWYYTRENGLRYAIGKFNGASAGEYITYLESGGPTLRGRVYDNAGGLKTTISASVSLNTWNCFIFRHVQSTKTIDHSLNGGSFTSAQTYTGTLGTHTGSLEIGQVGNGNDSTFYWDGYLDEIVLAARAWDDTDVAEYYQSGAGRGYVQASTGNRRRRALICGAA